ncbi:MAG: copper amine oxidase N-terminal domain-containing protein, partial [Peptococcaceae bacterium]|nr:copper amine oxidase N-terminal domain-containing protein [Peptococcaceae bacterium]
MKRFLAGLATGLVAGLIIATALGAIAADDIRLIINGRDITASMDVKPQIIEGRVMVPARFVADNLKARVEWDGDGRAVIITSDKTMLPGSSEPGYLEPLVGHPYHTSEELDEIYRAELEALDMKITYKG